MLKYYLPGHSETANDAQALPKGARGHNEFNPRIFAELAADWCHARRDGWEWDWPEFFVIIDEDGNEFHFEVTRELLPDFYANPGPRRPA